MAPGDKPLVWLRGEVKSPPFSAAARLEAGIRLRQLQQGVTLGMDADAIVIAGVFSKKTPQTPKHVIEDCQRRLRRYDQEAT